MVPTLCASAGAGADGRLVRSENGTSYNRWPPARRNRTSLRALMLCAVSIAVRTVRSTSGRAARSSGLSKPRAWTIWSRPGSWSAPSHDWSSRCTSVPTIASPRPGGEACPRAVIFKPTRDRYAERRAGLQHGTEPVGFQRNPRSPASPRGGVATSNGVAERQESADAPVESTSGRSRPSHCCAFVERGCRTAEKAAHRVRQHLRKTPAPRLHDAVLQDRRKIQSVTRAGQCDVEESPGLVLFALALRFVTLGYERTNGNGRRLHPHRRR